MRTKENSVFKTTNEMRVLNLESFKGYPNLIAEIESCGYSLTQLFQITSIPLDRLRSIVGAHTDPDLNELFALMRVLGADFDYLTSRELAVSDGHVSYREKAIPILNVLHKLNTILRDSQIQMFNCDVENYHAAAEIISKCENSDITYAEFCRLQKVVHNLQQHIDSSLRCRARIALIQDQPEQARDELLRCYDLLDERGKVDLLGNAQSNARWMHSQGEAIAGCA